ncbi:putative toxin-antitoxin system toxin component, PIN family [Candidatus Roizmanbacteria bacterium RIFCSPLOWO2_01_FULL_41_22]|uniref:Putative toxin-antitoxin system toxin component, PIN family n=2 Tax=Candidatus Roizmaniibacteriota TaxID=1752723 RepID=A0A1F7JQS7_9BACT|nr:MAG: putative toxin-antitoxin system toxin component, PIN family [Candidatus Roizmanbacteria bacterium RIFCSPLOWO2_01_FULL_41_22]OGK57969.1 MAG: putative toxin-antitoxin system toxin component, PIN family [Candidatus Roizmanbacteria bacterium RIFCSPLOWO2_02_FULL_41_9]
MEQIPIFLDTDVIISALISSKGAAFTILNNQMLQKIVSKYIVEEVTEVCRRLKISKQKQSTLKNLTQISVQLKKEELMKTFAGYVLDQEDCHVVAGAVISGTKFLLTYNLKDYRTLKISNDLSVMVMSPGTFLQYLRSL